jgi:hypothetical protein
MKPLRTIQLVLSGTTLALAAIAGGSGAAALGAGPVPPPKLTIEQPASGSATNNTTPVVTGRTDNHPEEFPEELDPSEYVKVSVYDALGAEVPPPPPAIPRSDGVWSVTLVTPLAPGQYKAVANQKGPGGLAIPAEVSFTVDTSAPVVVLAAPVSGSSTTADSVTVAGTAGTARGDLPAIAVALYSGGAAGPQTPLETLGVQALSDGTWAGTFGGLAPGTYTLRASQRDVAGNAGTSSPATFTVAVAPTPPGPTASFSWVPSAPAVGQTVSLVSDSTDLASPLTGFAWALAPNAPFAAGKPVLTTSFSTPGAHVVRLRVSDAAGRSSIATETVPVSAYASVLMQPFPVVRIAGAITGKGARIKLLTVQAPVGARVTVRCRGGGCRPRSESRSAKASSTSKQNAAAILLTFKRFQRDYRAGTRLEVLVVKPGEIGKYTSLKIRRHKVPVRQDACIAVAGSNPIPCASS